MKRFLFILLLVVRGFYGSRAQKMPEDYYYEGRKAFVNTLHKDYATALADFNYIVNKHPANHLCPEAYYSIGLIYSEQGKEAQAMEAYRYAIADYEAKIKPGTAEFSYISIDVSRAASSLSDIYERQGRYDSALYFLYLYDTAFEKIGGCGMYVSSAALDMKFRFAKLYLKANRIREAEQVLVQGIASAQNVHEKDSTVIILRELLLKHEQPKLLKQQMEAAVNNFVIDTMSYHDKWRNNADTFTFYYCKINFLGIKVSFFYQEPYATAYQDDNGNMIPVVSPSFWTGKLTERDKIIADLKRFTLYKLVQGL